LTLLNNRKRLLLHLGAASPSDPGDVDDVTTGMSGGESRKGAEWANLEEGWKLFERDLVKLQQFIEINATGFRKILKKWDKRSKTSTKELYLERQVEIQPCFNREVNQGAKVELRLRELTSSRPYGSPSASPKWPTL
jgi:CDK inhibitor PHO81